MKISSKLVVGAGALAALGSSFAQTKNFEGLSLNLGLSETKFKNETSSATTSQWKNTSSLEAVHYTALNDNWLLGVGLGFDTGGAKLTSGGNGEIVDYGPDGSVCSSPDPLCYGYRTGGSSTTKLGRSISLSLIPAYAISANQLMFIRVGVNSTKLTQQSTGGDGGWVDESWNFTPASGGGSPTGKKSLSGYSFGFGYRHQLSKVLFLQGEYRVEQYKRNIPLNVKPSSQGLVLGLGYQF